MTDNQVWVILKRTLDEALSRAGLSSVLVIRAYQQRLQGTEASEQQVVYFHRNSSRKYGFPKKETIEVNPGEFITKEKYWIESVYQVTSQFEEDPSNLAQLTPFDIVDIIASQLQSDYVLQSLLSQGIGTDRITEIRTPYFKDDSDRFEQEPNFDLVLTYQREIEYAVPSADITQCISRV